MHASFLISALRATVEMLALCLIAQGMLYLMAGQSRERNVIYKLFRLITGPVVSIVAFPLPKSTPRALLGVLSFALLFSLWIGLAILRKFI